MKEIPILFSTVMVQAILDNRKTMTRRIVKPQPIWNVEQDGNLYEGDHKGYVKVDGHPNWAHQFAHEFSKWKAGDILWVREEHYRWGVWIKNGLTGSGKQKWKFTPKTSNIFYKEDCEKYNFRLSRDKENPDKPQWYKRLARFMPKEAARIWLQVTDVRVERLQDITEEDAKAEGVEKIDEGPFPWKHYGGQYASCADAKTSCRSLWQSINGDESWEANPWVWVINFKVLSTTGKPDYKH